MTSDSEILAGSSIVIDYGGEADGRHDPDAKAYDLEYEDEIESPVIISYSVWDE